MNLYGVDLLHTWALGVLQCYVGFVLWHFGRCKFFSSQSGWVSNEEDLKVGMLHIKSEMWKYGAEGRKSDPRWSKKGSEVYL